MGTQRLEMDLLNDGCYFDVARTLGIDLPADDPLPMPDLPVDDPTPEVEPGCVTLRVRGGGMSLKAIRESPVGRKHLQEAVGFSGYPWDVALLPAGYYRLQLYGYGFDDMTMDVGRVINGCQNWINANRGLKGKARVTPAAFLVAALLCIRTKGPRDPVECRHLLCPEKSSGCPEKSSPHDCWLGIQLHGGRLRLSHFLRDWEIFGLGASLMWTLP